MSFIDKAKQSLSDAVDKHGDKIEQGIDKAAGAINDKTGGKYADKVSKGTGALKDGLDKLDGKDDDLSSGSGPGARGPHQG